MNESLAELVKRLRAHSKWAQNEARPPLLKAHLDWAEHDALLDAAEALLSAAKSLLKETKRGGEHETHDSMWLFDLRVACGLEEDIDEEQR